MLSDLRGLCRIECPDQIFARDANPVRRFEEAFAHAVTNHHLLGVIRAAALRRTRLFAAYYAADRGLLIELALYGRFEEIPELLFFKREHPRNSRMITGSVQRQGWVRAERQWLGRLAK